MIYLAGAGCGAWGLLTLRAVRMIQKADCILYDRLLDPEILAFTLRHCDCIHVGKKAGKYAMAQEEVQRLMIRKAARSDTVIQLKGGDPRVFGRAGEEAQALVQTHTSFETIPGASSGIDGLAFADIPIIHRGHASGAHLMSAHGKAGTMSDLDYADVAHTRDTLIFYMELQQLSAIVSELMQAGRDPNTSITLVSNAGHTTQTTVAVALKDIENRDLSAVVSPALIVIDEVIGLQEELNLMKQRPLFQKYYLLPQFVDAKRGLQLELQDLGTAVGCIITGRIYVDPALLDDANLQETGVLVFSSRNAIEIFFTQLMQRRQDIRQLSIVKIAVVGEKNRQMLARYDIQADMQPRQKDNEHLALELQKHISKNGRLVLAKADSGNRVLFGQLQEHAYVSLCKVYTVRELPFDLPQHIHDGALFTCNFHARACLGRLMECQDVTELRVYSMGAYTTRTLHSYGCQHITELPKADKGLFGTCTIEKEAHA